MMTQAQLIALLIQHGLPAVLEMRKIFNDPKAEVTEEDWNKLSDINSRPFSFYEGPRQS